MRQNNTQHWFIFVVVLFVCLILFFFITKFVFCISNAQSRESWDRKQSNDQKQQNVFFFFSQIQAQQFIWFIELNIIGAGIWPFFPRLFLHSLSKLQRVSLGTFWNENWCTSTFCVMEMTFCDRNLYVENTLKVWRRNGDNYCRRYTHTHISIVSDGYKYWLEIDLSGIKWLLFSVHIVLLFFPPSFSRGNS